MALSNVPLAKIWERYFLKEFVKVFLLFLLGFYGLYVIIDYSTHSHSFKNYHFSFWDIGSFYAYEFVTKMDILVPFAALIASIKTLCGLNLRNELVALMSSGVKLRRLLLPFVLMGVLLTGLLFVNTEVFQPRALKYHNLLSQTRAKAKQKKNRLTPVQQLSLEDGSLLVFQAYDELTSQFHDAYWIRSVNDIYRFRDLMPYGEQPLGKNVEHFKRQGNGTLIITESFDQRAMPEMLFNKNTLHDTVTSPNDQSLSTLSQKMPSNRSVMNEKEARVATAFYYKLAAPWICLLAVVATAPFCIRFGRSLPVFFIYAFSLFGLVATFLVLDASVILAERQVLTPHVAIWGPFGMICGFFMLRFMYKTA